MQPVRLGPIRSFCFRPPIFIARRSSARRHECRRCARTLPSAAPQLLIFIHLIAISTPAHAMGAISSAKSLPHRQDGEHSPSQCLCLDWTSPSSACATHMNTRQGLVQYLDISFFGPSACRSFSNPLYNAMYCSVSTQYIILRSPTTSSTTLPHLPVST